MKKPLGHHDTPNFAADLRRAGRALDGVRRELAAQPRPVAHEDGRRGRCGHPDCPHVHLRGSRFCADHLSDSRAAAIAAERADQ